jgi:CubicO group peptidase (beta-lactamase class C family)
VAVPQALSDARLEALLTVIDAELQELVSKDAVPGVAMLVARQGRIVHARGYGWLDLEDRRPMETSSLLRIYSFTKLVTAAAVMMLVDDNRLSLTDPVSRWIPELSRMTRLPRGTEHPGTRPEVRAPITVEHLLTHTAGLGYGMDNHPVDVLVREAGLLTPVLSSVFPLEQLILKLAELPLDSEPGTVWRYGLSHDVLGRLIELVAGESFGAFLERRIFQPLGMDDTGFVVPPTKLARFGPLYVPDGAGSFEILDSVNTSPYLMPENAQMGGGGLVSTVRDYARFLSMLASGGIHDGVRLLRPETATTMITNRLTGARFPIGFDDPWPDMGYGLGVGVAPQGLARFGWLGASGASAWVYPGAELMTIVIPQTFQHWTATDLVDQLVSEALGGSSGNLQQAPH